MRHGHKTTRLFRFAPIAMAAAAMVIVGLACNGNGAGGVLGGGGGSSDNVLLGDALGFGGTVSGKMFESSSTRESLADPTAAQVVPLTIDTANTCVRVRDLVGGKLFDTNGREIGERPLGTDGSFNLDGLPVGVDFIVCVDEACNNSCDIESCVNIPSDGNGGVGTLEDVRVDPLTTMVLAKLRRLIKDRGIDPRDLPISPVAVVARIVDAYTNLFEESGIDQEVTLDDLETATREGLAQLFDTILPARARTGMQIVEGNLDAATARDDNGLAIAAAKVFLRAGFPVADTPGGLDLSVLGTLDDVTVTSEEELFGGPSAFDEFMGPPGPDGPGGPDGEFLGGTGPGDFPGDFPGDLPGDFPGDILDGLGGELPGGVLDGLVDVPAAQEQPQGDSVVIFVSMVAEPDRNFAVSDGNDGGTPQLPVINDKLLMRMARLQSRNRRITLADLHLLLTDIDEGLGARLTYFVELPNFFGPPLDIFETADGQGKAVNLNRLFARIFDGGFFNLDEAAFDRRESELRGVVRELLSGTVPPGFRRLFAGFSTDRVDGVEDLARRIRDARAHLPFNHTGESNFYVIADGDPFNSDVPVSAITVDADVTLDGEVTRVEFNPDGNGAYYLGFTERTERGIVELIVRETGRFLQSNRGPVRLNMSDSAVFGNVGGLSFKEFASNTGTFFPATNVSVISGQFEPQSLEPQPSGREVPGPFEQILVLATEPGPGAEPVRVDYDGSTGVATFNPFGRHLLMFLPDSEQTGEFALFNEDTGRPASERDPREFFNAPVDRPEGFEDFFNGVDEFQDFTGGGDPGQIDSDLVNFLDDFLADGTDMLPPDGVLPGDNPGDLPPLVDDGTTPDDGTIPPPAADGTTGDGNDLTPAGVDDGTPTDGTDATTDPSAGDTTTPVDGVTDGTDVPIDDTATGDEGLLDPTLDGVDGEHGPNEPGFDDPSHGEVPFDGGFFEPQLIVVRASDIVGISLRPERFTQVFGTEVPNDRYDPESDPYFDDINLNGIQDEGEPTSPFRPTLFDANDWRSTDIRLYYRRADNGGSVTFDDVAFDSDTPQTLDGAGLVPRTYRPRLNAFRFGRPNTSINMLTAFLPPAFFDGTHSLNRDTKVDIFTAIAVINLVMDQVFNVEASIDIDGFGPLPRTRMLTDAHLFVTPIGDPFQLLLRGFEQRSRPADRSGL